MKVFSIVLILIHFVTIIVTNEKVMENKDIYGGDMVGEVPKQKGVMRKASAKTQRLWPNSTVYYKIAKKIFSAKETDIIESTMRYIESMTCVLFKKRVKETDYVNIMRGPGCSSGVGRKGGKQDLSLADGCIYKGTIIHELMHALGFYHEHMRSDRDSYLTIHMNHVKPGAEKNFEKNPSSKNRLLTKFDYDSIMIYKSTSFSKNGENTMVSKDPEQKLLSPNKKTEMTELDAQSIKILYDCPQK